MNRDFSDVLRALVEHGARFLVVGAHSLAVHGLPRATGDLDIWIEPTPDNADRAWAALIVFGAPVEALGFSSSDLTATNRVLQVGLPPRRIDLLTGITGVEIDAAWATRVTHEVDGIPVPFLGREALVQNKRAAGRLKDLADLEALGNSD